MTNPDWRALASRADWLDLLLNICAPVLAHGSSRTLKQAMPVESPAAKQDRSHFSHLEAVARTLAGLAPWLDVAGLESDERKRQDEAKSQAQATLASITDPASADYLNFSRGAQPLVDAAFLALAILRAPRSLWADLPDNVRGRIVSELARTRTIRPPENNWLLFPAIIEAFFRAVGVTHDDRRIAFALQRMEASYLGDGIYADGKGFRFDYYNSFVIHPFLIDILRASTSDSNSAGREAGRLRIVLDRARRHAAQLERLVSPEGAMPVIGRSMTYRCGNLHLLAQLALLKGLRDGPTPAQARGAIARAAGRSLLAEGTFDADGWLTVGYCGSQPGLAERYISTGSLYMCTLSFLPLGLPRDDPFWLAPPEATTSEQAYSGRNIERDKALDS